MRITAIEDLHCDGGWRTFSFLKISTDDGIVGWSEFSQNYGSPGLSGAVKALGARLVGEDPRDVRRLTDFLHGITRQAPGGANHQAVGAIQNALIDIKAKALGVPVHEMLGGAMRTRLPAYWSHCGSYRLTHANLIGKPAVQSAADLIALGREVAAAGFPALKCNILRFDGPQPMMFMPGFPDHARGEPLNPSRAACRAIAETVAALRQGAGPDVGILVDLNFNFRPEGYIDCLRQLRDVDLDWIELDILDADALSAVRQASHVAVASGESLFGRRQYKPFLTARSMDVVIIDVLWNGLLESLDVATMADAYELNVAPHNFYSHLSSLISASFCALVPNFRIMEVDVDDVPWKDDLVTQAPVIDQGSFVLPSIPGWGSDINEEVVAAHPAAGVRPVRQPLGVAT
jgi:L-alanine-DL-glutamate epimerase-like enolase superfamily enzyme